MKNTARDFSFISCKWLHFICFVENIQTSLRKIYGRINEKSCVRINGYFYIQKTLIILMGINKVHNIFLISKRKGKNFLLDTLTKLTNFVRYCNYFSPFSPQEFIFIQSILKLNNIFFILFTIQENCSISLRIILIN